MLCASFNFGALDVSKSPPLIKPLCLWALSKVFSLQRSLRLWHAARRSFDGGKSTGVVADWSVRKGNIKRSDTKLHTQRKRAKWKGVTMRMACGNAVASNASLICNIHSSPVRQRWQLLIICIRKRGPCGFVEARACSFSGRPSFMDIELAILQQIVQRLILATSPLIRH